MPFFNTLINKLPSHWISLADQMLVSGTNFIIGVVLARTLGVQVFGIYSVATIYLLYANTFQSSLVVSPMMTAIPHEVDQAKQKELLSGFFGYALILILISVFTVGLIVYFLGKVLPSLQLGEITLPLMLSIIGFQLQDWLRRALYSLHKTVWVLFLDIFAYGGQLASLSILYYKNVLTPSSVLLSMAGVFFLSASLILTIQNIVPSFKQALIVIKTHWRGSRDFLIAWQLQWAGSQGLALFGGGVLGSHIVGALRASFNLVAPVNVLFQWMENVIPVRAVTHLKNGGLPDMYHFLSRLAWIGGVGFGVVVVALYFFAEPLLGLIYGDAYRPYAFFVFLQAIYLWLSHFYRLEFYACRATHRTADIARASLIMALVAIGSGMLGVYLIGGSAVILALILGQSVSHLYLFYRRKSKR